ncbi:type II toxin-antitoxin system Phd/YefM family antitoxin [Paradevosia shaoguanensis]|uniref:type II toxin-antitoxin system Phd/YefM family antitoxin n=1 Tax=Paradevosia shaoguanensis TaxID=1335043 RepID=UPI0019323681|nr:type II toxin-antitoxin system prevent-host-death family antitoxin [Paradevosia shaoguanensis]
MRTKSISDFRKNIAEDINDVVEDHVPLLITRGGGKPAAVVMSLEDFASWQETNYLLGSPKNAKRLLRSIRQLEEGKATERKLIE